MTRQEQQRFAEIIPSRMAVAAIGRAVLDREGPDVFEIPDDRCGHPDGCDNVVSSMGDECAFHSEVTSRFDWIVGQHRVPLAADGRWDGFRSLVRSDHAVRRLSAVSRFWAKVDRSTEYDGCWLWRASVDISGFGLFSINDTLQLAHRVSWMMEHGAIPEGARILQRCRNHRCVNPAHLRSNRPVVVRPASAPRYTPE